MSSRLTQLAIAAAMLLILVVSALTVWRFEHTLATGQTLILQLAPVDPRSIMQGDYMALAYAIDLELPDDAAQFSYAWLNVAVNEAASLHSLSNQLPQQDGTVGLLLRQRDGIYSVGPNAFFFTEGSAAVYEQARYGQFKVDGSGKALLTGLLDENLQLLGENAR
ncbi:GDYXXLXY domain-containing protein [Rheinheimera maricola]|uniref:GDYXXLXY domain-containing protein n=1 Tax=Rheinheimera maricola TaxID=2793282 RepID=A0ABS7X7J4_9GAMM|nr:GDYXXLXY domain-containing protein [Rheinheimera maricola]MBZ9611301.1 GDYXXLXY domain-containing protein [Rheinheimera maricola]